MSWRENKLIHTHSRAAKQGRIKFLTVFFLVFSALIIIQLFNLQILKGGFYAALALGQQQLYQKLFPERGSIYVVENNGGQQTLFPLVTNRDWPMLYNVPKDITNPQETAEKLFELFGLPAEVDMVKVESELFSDISPDLDPALASEIKQNRLEKWQEEQKAKELARLAGL